MNKYMMRKYRRRRRIAFCVLIVLFICVLVAWHFADPDMRAQKVQERYMSAEETITLETVSFLDTAAPNL